MRRADDCVKQDDYVDDSFSFKDLISNETITRRLPGIDINEIQI